MSQGGNRTRKGRELRNLIGVLMGVGAASTAMAQTVPTTITIDSSFGRTPGQIGPSASNAAVTGNRGATYNVNNLYTIAESRGRTAGSNLFHSFGTFNVGAGDAAVFTTMTASLQNIIARVSGPSASTIEGLLAVNAAAGSAPNLFFINPAGVTFGAGAQVDVPAAFHVSTANELRFADDTTFKAGSGPDSSMTTAAPAAFGFVGGSSDIAFKGVHADLLEGETPFAATSFDVTAAGVTLEDSSISLPRAQVRIVAAGAAPGSIPIGGIDGVATTALQGDVRLTRSRVDVRPDPFAEDAPANDDFPTDQPIPLDDFPLDDLPINLTTDDAQVDDFPADLLNNDDLLEDDFAAASLTVAGTMTDSANIVLLGRNVVIDNTELNASNQSAGAIRVRAAGDVNVTGETNLLAEIGGSGVAGTIEVVARGAIDIAGGSDYASLSTRVETGDTAAVTPSNGIVLHGGSVSVRRATFDATVQSSTPIPIDVFLNPQTDAPAPVSPAPEAQPSISILSDSFITVEESQISASSVLQDNAAAGDILLRSQGGGDIVVRASTISNTALLLGRAGTIQIETAGDVRLSSGVVSAESFGGATGTINVRGDEIVLNDNSSISVDLGAVDFGSPSSVGSITLDAGSRVAVDPSSNIAARSGGDAANPQAAPRGQIRINTPRLEVDGQITTTTSGNLAASDIVIDGGSAGLTIRGTGVITSSSTVDDGAPRPDTTGGFQPDDPDDAIDDFRVIDLIAPGTPSGDAGTISVLGQDITIAGVQLRSASEVDALGNAGSIRVSSANNLAVSGSQLRTDTASSGKAGNIALAARTITIGPSLISSQAASNSSGQTGAIDVMASNSIELRDSTVSIANAARVEDPSMTPLGRIRLGAPVIELLNSNVTAQSSENIAASAIAVDATDGLTIRNSNITTSAQDGDGGRIDVRGQRFTVLDRSQISTSVLGTQSGSGGDITVRANVLLARTGFIQANTAARGASGGNVLLAVGQLLPVGALVTGGDVPLQFDPQRNGINAVQAAAPDGVAGNIQLTGPALDLVGDLQNVDAEFVATGPLGQDLCKRSTTSSLTQVGRGGARPLSTGLVRPDTSLPLLPELPALSLRLTSQAPSTAKCGH